MKIHIASALLLTLGGIASTSSAQVAFNFSTGNVLNTMAMATRPDSSGKFEIESADDFVLGDTTKITSATFTGLLAGVAGNPTIVGVTVEMYRVFPLDSNTSRTPQVVTRANSPSDVAFAERSSEDSTLSFTTSILSSSFTALNSVQPGGIHAFPNQTTGGSGPLTGQEVQFNVTFTSPFTLPADHYFFVPQVELSNGDFYWLSASRPITGTGTPFMPDLQAWTRDENLDPDWSRVGTDIVGGATPPTFNAAFTLTGVTSPVPEPSTYGLFGAVALAGLVLARRKMRQ